MNRILFRTCTIAGALGVFTACTDTPTSTPTPRIAPTDVPAYDATTPFNNAGQCMADDAVRAPTGTISGVKFGDAPLSAINCTSQDVKIATAAVLNYLLADSLGNFSGIPIPFDSTTNVTCTVGQGIQLTMSARLNETASSTRSDIGIWLATDGGKAITGLCNHYNLPVNPLEPGTGVSNGDLDSCGDLNAGAVVPNFPLGTFNTVCETADSSTNSRLHIGSCLGWKEPGGDKVCPLPDAKPNQVPNWVTDSPDGFRFGTLYANKSKCNCDGFDVPITVVRNPSVSLTKTADAASVNAGSQIGFTVTVTNGGPAPATNVLLTDTLPAGTGVLWSIATNPVPTGWALNGAAGSQILTYTATSLGITSTSVHVVSGTTAASCKQYDNTARVTVSNQANVDPASASTTVNCPTLGITKLPATQTVNAGSSFSWTVVLTNSGVGTAVGATINDSLPVVSGVSYSLGAGSDASCAIASGKLTCGPTDLAQNATITAIISATTTSSAACSASGFTNTATGSASNASSVQASATTTIPCPNLSITKTPDDSTNTGYFVIPPGTATFSITVSNSSAAGTGTANNVVLTDTLPADLTWTANNTTQCPSPMGTVTGSDTKTHQLLVCNIGSLAAGASFTVTVSATVPASFVLVPPSPAGTPIEIDGDLADNLGVAGKDWASLGNSLLNCLSNPRIGCDIDLPTGTTDNSFGQGTKEDSPVPSVVSGSIPNNKSDLLRFYVSTERFVSNNFLYLAWERVQAPKGTTNMDFELNQAAALSANGVTPVRTAGDILIKYDLAQGGTTPTLGFHKWVTSGNPATLCEASNSLPCWGKGTAVIAGGAAAINHGIVVDPILAAGQAGNRNLDSLTFGEASIDLQTAGIFQAGSCQSFGQAYLKSRSSTAFTSEIKDFIAPIPISVTNCAPALIPNKAWVVASNVTAKSDTGEIKVNSP